MLPTMLEIKIHAGDSQPYRTRVNEHKQDKPHGFRMSLVKPPQYRQTTGNLVPDVNVHLSSQGKEHVHARTEFDKTKLFSLVHLRALLYIPNDTTRHRPGYLPEQDFFAGRCLHCDAGPLIKR